MLIHDIRIKISKLKHFNIGKMELYDLNENEIRNIILDNTKKISPRKFKTLVETYFNINNWSYFQKKEKTENKEYILLVRGILNALKVEYYMTSLKIKEDGKWINTRKYVIKI